MERRKNLWKAGHSTLKQAYELLHEVCGQVIGSRGTRRHIGRVVGEAQLRQGLPLGSSRAVREG